MDHGSLAGAGKKIKAALMPASAGLTNPSSYLRRLQEVSRGGWDCVIKALPLCVCVGGEGRGDGFEDSRKNYYQSNGSDKEGLSLGQETNLREHLRQASLQFTMGVG